MKKSVVSTLALIKFTNEVLFVMSEKTDNNLCNDEVAIFGLTEIIDGFRKLGANVNPFIAVNAHHEECIKETKDFLANSSDPNAKLPDCLQYGFEYEGLTFNLKGITTPILVDKRFELIFNELSIIRNRMTKETEATKFGLEYGQEFLGRLNELEKYETGSFIRETDDDDDDDSGESPKEQSFKEFLDSVLSDASGAGRAGRPQHIGDLLEDLLGGSSRQRVNKTTVKIGHDSAEIDFGHDEVITYEELDKLYKESNSNKGRQQVNDSLTDKTHKVLAAVEMLTGRQKSNYKVHVKNAKGYEMSHTFTFDSDLLKTHFAATLTNLVRTK